MINAPAVCTAGRREACRAVGSKQACRRVFLGVIALLVAAGVATINRQASMPSMGETPMPGGWALSSMWMPMCGQSRLGPAFHFLGMWMTMMVTMMLPALAPALWQHRKILTETGARYPTLLMTVMGIGYFFAWAVPGATVYPLGVTLVQALIQMPSLARAVPVLSGGVIVAAGLLQFTAWKAGHLHACKELSCSDRETPANALRRGLSLGFHCICSCSGFTAALLVVGITDLYSMTIMTAAIISERAMPANDCVAHAIGICLVVAGLILSIQAVALV